MPSVPTNPSSTSKAGITTSSTGERHIPASTRADGSVRKEIRVRPGYKPPEDVEVYRNRTAQAWKNRGSDGVPGADSLQGSRGGGSGGVGLAATVGGTAAANKNAKRKEARKKAAAAPSSSTSTTADPAKAAANAAPAVQSPTVTAEVDKDKEARKLTKKLRQARELKDRKEQGEGLLPEQFQKVIQINELIRQLDSLGFDADGEEKGKAVAGNGGKEEIAG